MGDSDITTCVVMNKHDDQLMTLFTEWMDTGLKIAIFQNLDSSPLVGEVMTRFKSRGQFLADSKLRWKRGRWNQGLINVGSAPLAQMFPNILKKFVLRNRELESSVERLETEGRKLRTWQQELEEKLEEMVKLKNEMEKDLYSKFIIVLNSKKAKIRELQSETNDKAEPKDEEAFQAQTDDSEASEEEAAKTEQNNKSNDVSTSRSSNSATDNRPSTSRKRDIDSFALDLLDDGGSSTKKSANSSRLTFTGEESDEDLFL